jgi:outer membrane lipoprotein SlyB
MLRTVGAAAMLALAAVMPAQEAAAQDPLAGAIVGGALGGIIGGAVGRGGGAVAAGAIIGAATGAIIASEAQRRASGYYAWRGGCYYRYPDGAWVRVSSRRCYY